MKPYIVSFLFPGPNYERLSDKEIPENLALHSAHLQSVQGNINDGMQVLAAPVMTPGRRVCAVSVFSHHLGSSGWPT